MKINDKLKQIQQRNEAKAYFNKNNSYRFSLKDYIVSFLITFFVGSVGLVVILNITSALRVNFSFFYILLGYLAAKAVIRYKGNGGDNIAGVDGALGLFFGMIVGYGIYLGSVIASMFGASVFLDISLYLQGFQYLYTANLMQAIFSLLGIFTTYYFIRNN